MMKDTDKYTDRDWEELAARFSDERTEIGSETENFSIEDNLNTEKQWRAMGTINNKDVINVDIAWNKLHGRLRDNGLLTKTVHIGDRNTMRLFARIAAAVVIIAGLGAAVLYIGNSWIFTGEKIVTAGNDQRNIQVTLPDGSMVWLNRNSKLSYNAGHEKRSRIVKLTGEAFFEVVHDASKPFTITAGNAKIKDIGTSFNVISSNSNKQVEVFVKTGKVLLSGGSGEGEIILEPGFIGTINRSGASKKLNDDRNYLSWNTGLLVYKGESLKKVFDDLKRVHNIDIIADDPEILNKTWSTTIVKSSQDTIIQIICTSFNLSYQKEGNNYHLSRN
jgi:transmembrane sensor